MAAGWLASGLLLTDQVVAQGLQILNRYHVLEKIEQARLAVLDKAVQMDSKYAIKERALNINDKYQLTNTADAAATYVLSTGQNLWQAALKYPIVQRANQLLHDGVNTATATLEEGKKLYQEQKNQNPVAEPEQIQS